MLIICIHGGGDGFHGLSLIAQTLGFAGACAGAAEGGENQTGENGDNADHNQQFD